MGDFQLEHPELPCNVSNMKEVMPSSKKPTALPRRELFIIWIIHASQAFQITMLFPILVFMIEHYEVGSRSSYSVGQYAGVLASLFPLAQFCTSILWGTISDSTGRKPWLAFGNVVSAISALLLGVCQSYTAACAVRFVGGLFNGTMTITKSVLGELCDGSNKAKGFGILNLAWGIGSVAGPVMSGLLAQPCEQYRIANCPHLLREYPFLLPCIAAAVFSAAALVASMSLKETLPQQLTYGKIPSSMRELKVITFRDCVGSTGEQAKHSECILHICNRVAVLPIVKEDGNQMEPNDEKIVLLKQDELSTEGKRSKSSWPMFMDRDVLLTSFCYSMTGLIFITTDELFPIFGAASESVGGLGLSSSALGVILGEGGIVLFLYTLLLYPVVAQKIGPLNCFRFGIITSVPIWIVFPVASLLSHMPKVQWALLSVTMAARSMIACTTFTGVLVLVSNSATAGNMGAVTGLSHSLCSFFRAVGPAFGGLVWSYAARQTFPLHQFLAWLSISCIALFAFCISTLLPPYLTHPK